MTVKRSCPIHPANPQSDRTEDAPYVVVSGAGEVLEAGPGATISSGDPVGLNLHDELADGQDSAVPAEVLNQAIRYPGRVVHGWGSWPPRTRGEPRRDIHWSVVLTQGAHGTRDEQRLVALGTPATASEAAHDALIDSRAHLRAVLDTAVDGIITIDEKGTMLSMNNAAERMFGYPPTTVLGHNVSMLMPPEYASRHDGYLSAYMETGEARIIGIGREVEGLRADGTHFPLELSVSEVLTAGVRRFTGIVRDITDRRAAQTAERRRLDELAHASRLSAMGEMTSGIAHELNQPLAAMVTFARAVTHMLDAGTLNDETLRSSLENIANQGLRAGGIVSRLRRLARKDTGQYEDVDLNAVVTDVLALVDHELRLGRTILECTLAEDLPRVHADRIQLEQVVLNLARNAVDAMAEHDGAGGRLEVATRRHGDHVQVDVRDTGPGIGADALPHLFDSFFTTKSAGIGLGLSISRSIMDAHGGQIRCENVSDGGARFILDLPLDQPEG